MKYASIKYGPRNKRVKELVRQGSCSAQDFLIAQFGEVPVGLDQDQPLTQALSFHGISECKGGIGRAFDLGCIDPSEPEHKIYINRVMTSGAGRALGLVAGRMAYARIHDALELAIELGTGAEGLALWVGAPLLAATLASSFRYVLASSFVKAFRPSLADVTGEEVMHSLAWKGEERSWTIQDVFRINAEEMMANPRKSWTEIKRGLDMLATMMPTGYFQQDVEIMGRMFNLMAAAYPAYGRLPTTVEEGGAFLHDIGIKTPETVRIYLGDECFKPLRDIFYKHDSGLLKYVFPPTAEINIGINAYRNKTVLEMYWKDAFPLMLGETFRLLGNSKGLERFGFDPDNRDIKGVPKLLRPEAGDAWAQSAQNFG